MNAEITSGATQTALKESRRLAQIEQQLEQTLQALQKHDELVKSHELLKESHARLAETNDELRDTILAIQGDLDVTRRENELEATKGDFHEATEALKEMGLWLIIEIVVFAGSVYLSLDDEGEYRVLGIGMALLSFVVFIWHFLYSVRRNARVRTIARRQSRGQEKQLLRAKRNQSMRQTALRSRGSSGEISII